jgi:ABC-2 type transport system permease protein
MSRVLAIAGREYRANVRSKAFIISLLLMPVLIAGGAAVPALLRGRVDVEDKRLVVADGTGKLLPLLQRAAEARNRRVVTDPATGRKVEPRFEVTAAAKVPLNDDDRLQLSQRIRKRELHAFVEIDPGVIEPPPAAGKDGDRQPGNGDDDGDGDRARRPGVRVHLESVMSQDVRRWLDRAVNDAVHGQRLGAMGLDPAAVGRATAGVPVSSRSLYRQDAQGKITTASDASRVVASVVPMALMLLMFMSLMMAQTMLQSTLEEKQQRIAEVLLGSVRPHQLMAGKLVGSTMVSLTTLSIYLAGGLWLVNHQGMGALIRHGVFGWALVFAAVGVLIYGAVFGAVGAACSELKEAQNYLMPIMMVLVFPLFVLWKVTEEPTGSFATALSFVPPWTPLLMPMRLAATEAIPLWQPLAGLAGTLLMAMVVVWAGGRVFRVGLLMQGKPPKLGELVRWIVKG